MSGNMRLSDLSGAVWSVRSGAGHHWTWTHMILSDCVRLCPEKLISHTDPPNSQAQRTQQDTCHMYMDMSMSMYMSMHMYVVSTTAPCAMHTHVHMHTPQILPEPHAHDVPPQTNLNWWNRGTVKLVCVGVALCRRMCVALLCLRRSLSNSLPDNLSFRQCAGGRQFRRK